MGKTPSSGKALEKWRAGMTPARKAAWRESIRVGHERAKRLRTVGTNGQAVVGEKTGRIVSITLQERTAGHYKPGSSRTIVLHNSPFEVDEVFNRLLPLLKQIKSPTPHHPVRRTPIIDLAS